jgi:hypothetical protein
VGGGSVSIYMEGRVQSDRYFVSRVQKSDGEPLCRNYPSPLQFEVERGRGHDECVVWDAAPRGH